jgi:uncharacterized protein YlxW (UPF0749 family)
MDYVEKFQDFVISNKVKQILEKVDSLIEESGADIISIDEKELEDIDEGASGAIAMGLFFVAFYAGYLLDRHIKIKKAEIDLKKKMTDETDPAKKLKMKEDFDKLSKDEKALKGEIATTETKLKKSKGKLSEKDTERAKRKVIQYQRELQCLKSHQDKIDAAKKL